MVIVLLKTLLRHDNPDLIGKDQALIHSLNAVAHKYAAIYEEAVREKLPDIADALDDDQMKNIFRLLRSDERVWNWLSESSRIRIRELVRRYSHRDLIENDVFDALSVNEFKPYLMAKFNSLQAAAQHEVIARSPRPEFADTTVALYSASGSYRHAESLGKDILIPMAQYLSRDQIVEVIRAVKTNGQIMWAGGTPDIIEEFFDKTVRHLADTQADWTDLMQRLLENKEADEYYSYPGLHRKLVARGIVRENP